MPEREITRTRKKLYGSAIFQQGIYIWKSHKVLHASDFIPIFSKGHNSIDGENSDKKKTCVSHFCVWNPYMKFQNPSMHDSWRRDRWMDARTDTQPETNMPRQLFRSWGHNNLHNDTPTQSDHSLCSSHKWRSFGFLTTHTSAQGRFRLHACVGWSIFAGCTFEPPHDKTNKMTFAPSQDSDQPGHPPSQIRVFAVCMTKHWALSYPMSALQRLIRLGRCPGWSESLLGTQIILLVLSWKGSFHYLSSEEPGLMFTISIILYSFRSVHTSIHGPLLTGNPVLSQLVLLQQCS